MRSVRVAVAAVFVWLVCLAPVAIAQEGAYDTAQECISARPPEVHVMDWGCTSTNDGEWKPSVKGSSYLLDGQTSGSGGMSGFGVFILFALVWMVVPFVIAGTMASSRGESVASALLLTGFLGWIGLAIVYFGQRKTLSVVEGLAAQGADRVARHDPSAQADDASGTPEQRLRRLKYLRSAGLVTEEEYDEQRQRILESL